MTNSDLIGYARMSKSGGAVKLSVDVTAFGKAETFEGKDGRKFVALVINSDNVKRLMSGEKEVTSVSQITDPVPTDAAE